MYRNKLLATTLAVVLIAGLGNNAFAAEDGLGGTPPDVPNVATPQFAETLIDFEACTTGASYNEDGATVTAIPPGNNVECQGFGQTPDGSTGAIGTGPGGLDGIRTDLGCTTTEVSVDIGDFNQDADDLFLEAYTSGDVLVDSDAIFIPGPFIGMETLTVSGDDIAYVLSGGVGLGGESNVYNDNVRFTCDKEEIVGGEFLPINSAALLVAGAQTNAIWIMSALAVIGSVAFGALYLNSKRD